MIIIPIHGLVTTPRRCGLMFTILRKRFGPRSTMQRALNTLKYHLLGKLMDHLERFGTVAVLSDSQFEKFNFIVMEAYENISKLLQSNEKDAINLLDINLKCQRVSASTIFQSTSSPSLRRHGLVYSGARIILHYHLTFDRLLLSLHCFHLNYFIMRRRLFNRPQGMIFQMILQMKFKTFLASKSNN